jgi:acyl-CoA synthetase (AMP-forming)/AMP-acid ligase II
MNLADLLGATAARHPARPAVTDVRSRETLTYGELAREAGQVARFLGDQGVQPGQRIGLLAPNALAHLPAAFGLLETGACLVPVAEGLTPAERAEVLRGADVNGCVAWPRGEPWPGPGRRARLAEGACAGLTYEWIDRDAAGPPAFTGLRPAFIRFTSGTTADAKGVVLTHESTLARVEAADRVLRFTEDDRVLWVLPLAYHFAVTIVAYVRAGAHILLCPDTLPGSVVSAIRELRATVLYASPLHFARLGGLPPSGPLSSLRLALSTSAPITAEIMERFAAVQGVPVAQAYGIIEAGLPCINLPGDGLAATSVGRVTPGYEIAVLDERGAALPAGATGEIALRGAGLFSAYYAPWRLGTEVMRDGWFLTGDLGRVDGAGAVHLEGRRKSVIFVGGLKFFPEEVEACLNAFPGVRESRVYGSPHARLGEVPRAEIVLDSPGCDLDALRRHCARALSSYKVPVDFRAVTAIARTAGGKILRRPAAITAPAVAGRASGP